LQALVLGAKLVNLRHLQLDDALKLVDPGLNTIHCRHSAIISRAYGLTTSSCSTVPAAAWPTQRRPETALIPTKLILESQSPARRFEFPTMDLAFSVGVSPTGI